MSVQQTQLIERGSQRSVILLRLGSLLTTLDVPLLIPSLSSILRLSGAITMVLVLPLSAIATPVIPIVSAIAAWTVVARRCSAQPEAVGDVVEDVDCRVYTSEIGLARSHREDGHVGKRMHALVGIGR